MKTLFGLMIVAMVTSTGCANILRKSNLRKNHGNADAKPQPVSGESSTVGDTDPNATLGLALRMGMRHFAAINATMSSVTGIPSGTQSVIRTYNAVKASLPNDTDPRFFQGANQVAMMKLATSYCEALVKMPGKLEAIVGGVKVRGTGAEVFADESNRRAIITAMIDAFWGHSIEARPDGEASLNTVSQLISELLTNNSLSSGTSDAVMIASCTAVLSAAPVLFY